MNMRNTSSALHTMPWPGLLQASSVSAPYADVAQLYRATQLNVGARDYTPGQGSSKPSGRVSIWLLHALDYQCPASQPLLQFPYAQVISYVRLGGVLPSV